MERVSVRGELPRDVHAKLKARASLEKKTVKRFVEDLLTEATKRKRRGE